MSKRVFKLQELESGSRCNCARIGKKSGRVLVTGGDDKRVTTWAIGKADPIMSLTGHTSAVQSVCFDLAERLVCAGSAGGTLKLWDLDQQKVIRTLNGHKSNCISIEFHPFGEIFASGSLDTDLKIWDLRRKECIQNYRGHTKGINTIRFSPDGRWVISGGEDGHVKLWDLTAGKLLHDFVGHNDSVNCIEFHPQELLLATGSDDKTVKFWDLETFELVSTTDLESTGVKAVCFDHEGSLLYTAYSDYLRMFTWEPARCTDSANVGWRDVTDMHFTHEQLVTCSVSHSNISIWMMKAQKQPLSATSREKPIIFDNNIDLRASFDVHKTNEMLKQFHEQSRVQSKPSEVSSQTPKKTSRGTQEIEEKSPPIISVPSKQKPLGLDFNNYWAPSNSQEVEEFVDELTKPHTTVYNILASRLANLKVVRGLWTSPRSDIRDAIETMVKLNDPAVVVDVLNVLLEKTTIFTLDLCIVLLPILHDLLSVRYDDYILTALKTINLLQNNFGTLIKSTLEAPPISGVDLSREERIEKCKSAYNGFRRIKDKLDDSKIGNEDIWQNSKLGQLRREVLVSLKSLLTLRDS